MSKEQSEVNSPVNRGTPRPSSEAFSPGNSFSTKKKIRLSHSVPPSPAKISHNRSPFMSPIPMSVSIKGNRLSRKCYDKNLPDSYFNQCFDVINELGSGSFAQVFKVKSKEDGRFYAIKKSKRKYLSNADRKRKINEVEKHEKLPKHINCVQFYKAWEENFDLYIQLELCEMTLAQFCDVYTVPESIVWNIFIDLLLALEHVHNHNIIHLDIKPENIFMSEDVCKLGDFGLALDATNIDSDPDEGDSKYLAPELMLNIFTKAADVFSLGITILEVASGLDIPRGESPWELFRRNQIPDDFLMKLGPELRLIVKKMMEQNHEARPSVNDILNMVSVQKFLEKRKCDLHKKSKCFEQSDDFLKHTASLMLPPVFDAGFHNISTDLKNEPKLLDCAANYSDEHLQSDGVCETDNFTDGESLVCPTVKKIDEKTDISTAVSHSSTIKENSKRFRKLSPVGSDADMVSPCKVAQILRKDF